MKKEYEARLAAAREEADGLVRNAVQTAQRKGDAEAIAPVRARGPRRLPVELAELETRVRDVIGIRAKLTGNVKKGKIVLQYYSQDELEHLIELLDRLEE